MLHPLHQLGGPRLSQLRHCAEPGTVQLLGSTSLQGQGSVVKKLLIEKGKLRIFHLKTCNIEDQGQGLVTASQGSPTWTPGNSRRGSSSGLQQEDS